MYSSMKKYGSLAFSLLILLSGNPARAQEPWHVPGAEARFTVKITSHPTVPAAGIVAILPDAGILPKGKFKADVVDESGKSLKADLLWHNPNEGAALVFENSSAELAWIYISPATEYPKASSLLRPSLLLFVRNSTNPSLELSHGLAATSPVTGADVDFTLVEQIAHTYSPVGRDEQTSSFYRGSFQTSKGGKAYFYTISKDGSEFFIDGKPGYSWPGVHDRGGSEHGQKGAWLELGAGVHGIEYFHFNQSYLGRECQLGFQAPGESKPRCEKHPELPNLDVTKPMRQSDFVHSGRAKLTAAASPQGPLAIVIPKWEKVLQPGQNPICLFQFSAFGHENFSTNTMFEWDFGGGRKLDQAQVSWLFSGLGNQRVGLSISNGQSKSTCSKLFFPKMQLLGSLPLLSINNAQDRRKVRDLYQVMCRATPPAKRPAELWDATLWVGLIAALDLSTDHVLLSELFERSREDILKLNDSQRWLLEDIFFNALRQADGQATVTWLNRFEQDEKAAPRKGQWKARRVEFYIFETNNLDKARQAANEFAGAAESLQQTELALIRLGDVELHGLHQDLAQRYYAQAQESRSSPAKAAAPAANPKPSHKPAASVSPTVDTWKVTAVREASFYATARSLINQQAYSEARRLLDQWELELPLNKIAGDFPLAEAQYYLALQEFKRAQKILTTFRQSVDLSNNLPQAMKMELYCLVRLGKDKEARDLAGVIIKRLPNHPLAKEVHELLAAAPADGKLVVDLEQKPVDWTSSEKVDAAKLFKLFNPDQTSSK